MTTHPTIKRRFVATDQNRPDWGLVSNWLGRTVTPGGTDHEADMRKLEAAVLESLSWNHEGVLLACCGASIRHLRIVLSGRRTGSHSRGDLLRDLLAQVFVLGKGTTQRSIYAFDPRIGGVVAYIRQRGVWGVKKLLWESIIDAKTMCWDMRAADQTADEAQMWPSDGDELEIDEAA